MPFLSKDEFEERPDDLASNEWQRMNATGAFIGLRYAYSDFWRNLTFGVSPSKYRIITGPGDTHVQVAQADSEEECLDLLKKLNSLNAEDVMAAHSSDRKDMLHQLVERAKSTHHVAVANEHQEFLSTEMLQKMSNLENENASLKQKLEEAQKAVRTKEAEKQDIQDDFSSVMAQQALEQVAKELNNEAKPAKSPTEVTYMENCPDNLGQPSEDSTSGDASGAEFSGGALPEISAKALTAKACMSEDAVSLLFPQSHGLAHTMELGELEGMSFEQRVMLGPFCSSVAKQFWQLAAAPYGAISCNHVEVEGILWEVIAHNPATEILVIGRKDLKTSILEVGFRGTVTEDAYGNTSWANWSLNLCAVAVPLQGIDGENLTVSVHKGRKAMLF
jgi:hypothetical protein